MHYTTHLLRHVRYVRAGIGRNIHRLRYDRRWTLRKLARLSGVPERRLDQFELGKNELGLAELVAIAPRV
ncbi:MAG: helix-turn-helix transcriptional regulator [Alphaproteobacteria bacterium]